MPSLISDDSLKPADIGDYLSARKLDGEEWAVSVCHDDSQRPLSREDADALFLVVFMQMFDRFREPDYPPVSADRDYIADLTLTGSPVAVWDFDYYSLSLSVDVPEPGGVQVSLRGHAPR